MTTQFAPAVTEDHDAEAVAALPEDLTIEQGKLRLPQQIHAIAIVVVPILGAVAALVTAAKIGVTALDLGLLVGMYLMTILGISVGYHRYFSHRSFKAVMPVRVVLGILGSMAAQGSLSYWVSNHRRHHRFTDRPGDIHSPYIDADRRLGTWEGFWHSHMGWTFDHRLTNPLLFAKDLYRDPVVAKVNQLYLLWVALGLALPALLGGLISHSWSGALTGFLWGGLVRLLFTYHSTNSIDSVTHMFGPQTFDTGDDSRNNVWIVLPTLGEGWHNNHHAFPNSALFGIEWWQIDPGGMLIRLLERLGWVWDVKRPSQQHIEAKRPASG